MACQYCRSKGKNTELIRSDSYLEGVHVDIRHNRLHAYGWYDGWELPSSSGAVGIDTQERPINFCPMCGRRLRKELVG